MFNRSTAILALAGLGLVTAAGSAAALQAVVAAPVTLYAAPMPMPGAQAVADAPAATALTVEGCLADAP